MCAYAPKKLFLSSGEWLLIVEYLSLRSLPILVRSYTVAVLMWRGVLGVPPAWWINSFNIGLWRERSEPSVIPDFDNSSLLAHLIKRKCSWICTYTRTHKYTHATYIHTHPHMHAHKRTHINTNWISNTPTTHMVRPAHLTFPGFVPPAAPARFSSNGLSVNGRSRRFSCALQKPQLLACKGSESQMLTRLLN